MKKDENYLWYKRDRERHEWIWDNEWMARYIDAGCDVIEMDYNEETEQIVGRSEINGFWSYEIDELLNFEKE